MMGSLAHGLDSLGGLLAQGPAVDAGNAIGLEHYLVVSAIA